jgi:glycerol dehydrogenase
MSKVIKMTLDELEISREDLVKIADKAASVVEWTYVPGIPTKERFIQAMIDTDEAGKRL